MAFTTQTRWSVCNDHWEIRLLNNGIEIARMSWREWQNLPANYPFASGPEPGIARARWRTRRPSLRAARGYLAAW